MAKQLKIQQWLADFLTRRDLNAPDGRHLFSYHATPEEFASLEEGLRHNVALVSPLYSNPLDLWNNVPNFDAVFVLYSSLCWQQRFDGGKWTYDIFLDNLNLSFGNSTQELKELISRGLAFWGLAENDKGYRYLGAIAREAGLPQQLLSENRGAVGHILHSVLHEALRTGQSGSIITRWVKSCQTLLPQSYRNSEIIELLADSINAILDIKKNLCAETLEGAMAELDTNTPGWRSRFPLPLYDEAARNLLNHLLEEAASSGHIAKGSPICVRRCLVRTADHGWSLQSRLDIPSKIEISHGEDRPRILALRISSGQKTFETVLTKHAEDGFYFSRQKHDVIFSEQDASQEILLRYTSPSGFCQTFACPGGMELDPDLPWIFEGKQYDYRFRQQGGGSVSGDVLYVALAPGWTAEHAENTGPLPGTNRNVFRMVTSGRLTKGNLAFSVRVSSLSEDASCDWSRDNRFWGVEMLQPSLAFCGKPKVILSMQDTKKTPRGEMLWKTPMMENFSPLSPSATPIGIVQVWFKASSGSSLRSRMLLLPAEASVRLSAREDGSGLVSLEHWQASRASLASQEQEVELECHTNGDNLDLVLKALPGRIPPATVELYVCWQDNPHHARIRVPFPRKGAYIFTADEQEIPPGRRFCAFLLHGLRLYCFSTGIRHMTLQLSLPDGKSLDYPLDARNNITVIRLADWQDVLLEMLAMTSGLDACVSLSILFDNRKIASWNVSRYESRLIPDTTTVVLDLLDSSMRPAQGYALKALPLALPELGSIPLAETLLEDGTPSGVWEIAKHLPRSGPWLIFDDTEGTSLRPLLWTICEGNDDTPLNSLQAAIAEKDKGARQKAFSSCLATMQQNLDAPEWTTLLSLLNHVRNLPLSTLEVWQALLRSPRIMALLALHPGISFQSITSRVSTELPFLWNSVFREDWHAASMLIKSYFEKLVPGDMASGLWQDHMKKCMENLGSCCPSVNALLHIALALPCEEDMLQRVCLYFHTDTVTETLFSGQNSEMQKLLRRHADDEWPTAFSELVNHERHNATSGRFLPFSQGHKNSVLGLPVLLAIQAFVSQAAFFPLPLDQNALFHIRKHLHFDAEWFEQASMLTVYHCTSEHLTTKE